MATGDNSVGAVLWRGVVAMNRTCSLMGYFVPFPMAAFNFASPTAANARIFYRSLLASWVAVDSLFFYKMYQTSLSLKTRVCAHFFWYWCVEFGFASLTLCGVLTEKVLDRATCTSRLFNPDKEPRFKGKRICILGNGPSLATGEPVGDVIDTMDEVVRFNNFQTKVSGLEKWTGTKTTVHFSDSMLYPTFPEYKVEGADVVLSLFMDRLMVAGSYFVFRICADLAFRATWKFMSDPALGWIPHEDIANMKKELGITKWKHPTSGVLAIDWFVRHRPDPSIPVYIAGFDFFQGPTIHYYSKTEPLYERVNDLIGVNIMHEPEREKVFVEKLVKEGKLQWLSASKNAASTK